MLVIKVVGMAVVTGGMTTVVDGSSVVVGTSVEVGSGSEVVVVAVTGGGVQAGGVYSGQPGQVAV